MRPQRRPHSGQEDRMHLRSTIHAMIWICVPALAGACGSTTEQSLEDGITAESPVTLKVTNDNWQDVNIYLVAGATQRRLSMPVRPTMSPASRVCQLPLRSALATLRLPVVAAMPETPTVTADGV